ncbi:SAM-dependent methyltransferase [Corynebacterium sp. TAE3-ERU30]|uniref:THUMP-like domain-containing protein n=1 Tax=Corynebacterium sp. TAE3-ERU30 TaxID=2849496 RepID=UPI001C46BADE|nr:SAM-dependent methyltransferase [Corynebacterium sp. TAE3-ERU30]MBV7281494.1 SAM-dependent methyltransferase [Corynebacterium sp. TAE3-ERU30]
MSLSPSEVHFLASHGPAIAHWAREHACTKASMIADHAAARAEFGDYGRAVVELVSARRSAAQKFRSGGEGLLMCQESAQQATPWQVAAARAERLRALCGEQALVNDVTCSIGSEGLELTRAGLRYLGSDLDPARVAMAAHNLAQGWCVRADALAPVAPSADVVVADPARRAGGRRITKVQDLVPPLPDLLAAYPDTPVVVKCAPGIDYAEWPGLVTVASVAGAVKETCLYSEQLGASGREAWVIDEAGTVDRYTSAEEPPEAPVGEVGRYIIDPDGAVVRAGLVRAYAQRHGLWMLNEHIAYLTGEQIPPGASGFEVLEAVPLKQLRQVMKRRAAGSLEILVRGVDVDPDVLRKKLKLRGSQAYACVIARLDRGAMAFVCHPRKHYDGVR